MNNKTEEMSELHLIQALRVIIASDPDCNCEHDTKDCCALQSDVFCARCMAAKALSSLPPSGAASEATEYQRGFNECRDKCLRIVDEHDGYTMRIEMLRAEALHED